MAEFLSYGEFSRSFEPDLLDPVDVALDSIQNFDHLSYEFSRDLSWSHSDDESTVSSQYQFKSLAEKLAEEAIYN